MKVGKKESFPLEFEAGLQMAAQFGGKQYVEGQKEPIMKMPSDFMDFIRVLIPMSGSDNAMEGEQINKYGNHVGSWNIGLTGYGESKRTMNISLRTNHKCFLVTVPGKTDYWE